MPRRNKSPESEQSIHEMADDVTREEMRLMYRDGRGWGAENLRLMRKLFLMYSGEIQNAVLEIGDGHPENQNAFLDFHNHGYPFRLSWSHYLVLMRIENPEERHFRVDLVFYNRILRCFVVVDLKTGDLTHGDIGQMMMYVSYYDRKVKPPAAPPPRPADAGRRPSPPRRSQPTMRC